MNVVNAAVVLIAETKWERREDATSAEDVGTSKGIALWADPDQDQETDVDQDPEQAPTQEVLQETDVTEDITEEATLPEGIVEEETTDQEAGHLKEIAEGKRAEAEVTLLAVVAEAEAEVAERFPALLLQSQPLLDQSLQFVSLAAQNLQHLKMKR